MKFKKIEIDAFRAYESKVNGTFDFTYRDKSSKEITANLVAIYGPNGFGKTSFYDAVEWGMTNRIKRLDNDEELAKDERKYSKDHAGKRKRQYILKNRNAKQEHGEVTITLDDGKRPPQKTKALTKAGQNDYFLKREDKDYKKEENSYFKDVILSQEGIDAFLRESKPEERYHRFVEYYEGCKDADRLYKNINQLLYENQTVKTDNNKKIKEKKNDINSKKIPEDIIEQINGIIQKLKEQDLIDLNELKPLEEDFSEKEINKLSHIIDKFKNKITSDKSGLLPGLKNHQIEIDNMDSELPEYLRAKKGKKQLDEKIKKLEKLLTSFEKLKKLKNESNKIKEEVEVYRKELDGLSEYKKLRPEHDKILDKIKSQTEEIERLKTQRTEKDKMITNTSSEIKKINLEFGSLKNELVELESEKASIDSNFDNYTLNLEKRDAIVNELQVSNKELRNLESQQEQIDEELTNYQNLKKDIKRGLGDEIEQLAIMFPEIHKNLISNQNVLKQVEKELQEFKGRADNIQSLREQQDKIISFGNSFILETKTKNCPLCGNPNFNDYKELLKQIESSNTLSVEYEDIAGKLKKQEEKIREIKGQIERLLEVLSQQIDLKAKEERARLKPLDRFIYKNRENEKRLNHQLDIIDGKIEQYKSRFENKSKEEIKADLDKNRRKFEALSNETKTKLKRMHKQASDLEMEKLDIKRDIDIRKKDIKGLKEDNSYTAYNNLIEMFPNFKSLDIQDAETRKNELTALIENNKTIKEQNSNEIKTIDSQLRRETEEDVSDDLKKSKIKRAKNEKTIRLFEEGLDKHFHKIPADIAKGLDSKRAEISKKIELIGDINNKLGTLKDRLEYADEILNLKKLNDDLEKLTKKKKNLDIVRAELKKNKKDLSKFIVDLIKNFFEEDLINRIFQRIDPHPEYKKIGFQPDLSGQAPKLNIYVEKEDGVMAPNLFLSTAQINVLSLSIFLARALNAEDDKGNSVDTIFIDDPIQSMDSINILSVIDLFRTIIHQHKKQVIVSTHDENFFNLLKKKIPSKYYPAKFLEFETFGKVVTSPE